MVKGLSISVWTNVYNKQIFYIKENKTGKERYLVC